MLNAFLGQCRIAAIKEREIEGGKFKVRLIDCPGMPTNIQTAESLDDAKFLCKMLVPEGAREYVRFVPLVTNNHKREK